MKFTPHRRKFIHQSLLCFGSWLGMDLIISACSSAEKKDKEYQLSSCQDLSQVSETELAKRKQFAYQTQASEPLKNCQNCKLYLPPKEGETCGACTLFKGPVEAQGSCTYWAPLEG